MNKPNVTKCFGVNTSTNNRYRLASNYMHFVSWTNALFVIFFFTSRSRSNHELNRIPNGNEFPWWNNIETWIKRIEHKMWFICIVNKRKSFEIREISVHTQSHKAATKNKIESIYRTWRRYVRWINNIMLSLIACSNAQSSSQRMAQLSRRERNLIG